MKTPAYAIGAMAVLALGLISFSLAGETSKKGQISFEDLVKQPPAATGTVNGPCDGYTGETKSACEQDLKAAFDHHRWKMEYTQKAYEAHHVYTLFVFVLVCALVALGMWLSYAEFQRGVREGTRASRRGLGQTGPQGTGENQADKAGGAEPPKNDSKSTQLELGSSGVKLTSPVLGVIILVVSMGFFYLYLKTVYPIEEAQASQSQQTAAEAAKPVEPGK